MATPSDAGLMSDAATPRAYGGFPSSSSARPRGPPSESHGGASEYGDGLADDQIPAGSRNVNDTTVPQVDDSIGRLVQKNFESFLEK